MKRAGHEVPGVVAVLCESMGMGGNQKGDMPRMGLIVSFAYHLALWCKSCKNKKQKRTQIFLTENQGFNQIKNIFQLHNYYG